MKNDRRLIIYILLCMILLFSMLYTVRDKVFNFSISKKGLTYIFKNYKIHLGNILWVKIDEFFHISNTMSDKEFIELSELAFKLNPHNAYFTSITILHMANTDFNIKQAIRLGQEFIDKNPKNSDTHKILGALGWLHIKQKEYTDAESALNTALKLVDKTGVDINEDYGEFLFPLNYLNMLELIYQLTDQKEKEQNIALIKQSIKEAGHKMPELEGTIDLNSKDEHHDHSHEHMLFIWERLLGKKFQHKE